MPVISYIAVYVVVWWICLFAVLPWGAHSQHDAGTVVRGSDPGAPALFRFWPKFVANTVLAAIVTALLFWLLGNSALQAYLR
jgi:predicted secreted protein